MMQNFLFRLGHNYRSKRTATIAVGLGLLGATILVWILINAILAINIFALIIAAPLVIWSATKVPQLAWFWGASASSADAAGAARGPAAYETVHDAGEDNDEDDGLEHVPMPDPATIIHGLPPRQDTTELSGCEQVRQTPVGTEIVLRTGRHTILKVKSAILYWCWAAPAIWACIAFFVFLPLGIYAGVSVAPWHLAASYGTAGGLTGLLLGVLMVFISYTSNRPWVEIAITPETIQYGDYKFDRRFAYGVMTSYESQDARFQGRFTEPVWGGTIIRLAYGRWGEDMKYMVNSRHAADIVIWMNEIIDSVGTPPPPRHDPYAGRKIELL
jgi:hypothetical protein